MKFAYLNLGCGLRFHPDWVNIDINYKNPKIINYDVRKGIPFSDGTFDAVYSSHLIEHLSRDEALTLLKECYRVLKPSGVIRVAVPDLEQICRMYLSMLEKAELDQEKWQANYDWMMLELFDQTVRRKSGGEMMNYLLQNPLSNRDFVVSRIGMEARKIIQPKTEKNDSINTRPKNLRMKGLAFFISYRQRRMRY